MANLNGQNIGTNYKGFINIGSTINQNISTSLQPLTDGDGNNLPIQVSTTQIVIGGGSSLGRLVVRGDGTNSIAVLETSAGVAVLTVVNGGALMNATLGFYCNFLFPATSNIITLEGKANLTASTVSRASLIFRTGVAPTVPVNGDIWFDGTNLFMRIGGATKTFTLV
jgi:hypothetical protein